MRPAVKAEAVVIGASAGAVDALAHILPLLPAKFPLPVFIVVHLPPDTKSLMAPLFIPKCQIEVKEAEDKEAIRPGVVYFSPPNYHLLIESGQTLALSSDEPELYSRPSINVLFESAADAYGSGLAGVILTGASEDGARGLRRISDVGGMAMAQKPATAEMRAMPEAALAACPAARSLTLEEIAALIKSLPVTGIIP